MEKDLKNLSTIVFEQREEKGKHKLLYQVIIYDGGLVVERDILNKLEESYMMVDKKDVTKLHNGILAILDNPKGRDGEVEDPYVVSLVYEYETVLTTSDVCGNKKSITDLYLDFMDKRRKLTAQEKKIMKL